MAQNQTNITLDQTVGYVCSHCGHGIFQSKIVIRKASRFLTGGTEDEHVPMGVLVCDSCNTVAKDILPKEVREILFPDVQIA